MALSAVLLVACSSESPSTEVEPSSAWIALCGSVSCGEGRCFVDFDEPACVCNPGYVAEGLSCVLSPPPSSPCHGVSCGHGSCLVVDDGRPVCLCDSGYEPDGLKCEPPADPCDPNPCATEGRTRCEPDGRAARCLCDEGRVELEGQCVLQTPCTPNPCTAPFQGVCEIVGESAGCLCDPGHAPADGGCNPHPVFDCGVLHLEGSPDGFEPDECPALSTPLALDAAPNLGHGISPAGDVDWYRIEATSGHVYEISAAGHVGLLLYGDAYAADGTTPIGSDHRAGAQLSFRFKALREGPAFVRIRAFRASEVGDYEVGAADLGLDDFADQPLDALEVTFDATVEGALTHRGDRDVFALTLVPGVSHAVSLEWRGTGDAVLELIDADGETVRQRRVGSSPRFHAWSAVGKTVWLRISAFDPAHLGGYALGLEQVGLDDYGDVPEEATLVSPGASVISVSIQRQGDVDVLAFDAEPAHVYKFACSNLSGGSYLDVAIAMLDESQQVLAPAGSNSAVFVEAAGGARYYLRLSPSSSVVTTASARCVLSDLGPDDCGDDVGDATLVNPGDTVGVFEAPLDRDVFSFVASVGHIYRAECAGPSHLLACGIRLLSSSGAELQTGNPVMIETPTAGLLYLEVIPGHGGNPPTPFTLSLEDLGLDDVGDDPQSATALQAGAPPFGGTLEIERDIDVFSFPGMASRIYQVTCETSGSASSNSLVVKLLSPSGQVLDQAQSSTSSGPAVVARELPLAGTYYFEVGCHYSSDCGSLPYSCVVEDLGLDDHGDDLSGATRIDVGDSGSAVLEFRGDVDAFVFTPQAGQVYLFTSASGTLTSFPLSATDDWGTPLASAVTSLSFKPRSTRDVVVTVGGGSRSPAGTYSWALTVLGFDDHGDSPMESTLLTLPSTGTAAHLEYPGDLDVFSLPVTAGRIYRMSCVRGSLLTFSLRALDSGGNLLATGTTYHSPTISLLAAASGTHYCEVSGGSSGMTGSYTLVVEDVGLDDHENVPTQATPLALGATIDAAIQYPGDRDVFVVPVDVNHFMQATCLTSTGSSSCGVGLKDVTGAILASSSGSIVWKAPVKGDAFVEVTGYPSDSVGLLSLSVRDLATDDHGDDILTATPLSGVGVATPGLLEAGSDKDFFSISLAANAAYTATVSPGPRVEVFSPTGVSMGSPYSSTLSFTTVLAGTHYVGVRSSSTGAAQAYSVVVQ